MEWIVTFNLVMAILFTALYAYQYVYLIVASFRKPKTYPDVEPSHRYAILISARNEENVIGSSLTVSGSRTIPQNCWTRMW